MGICSLNLLINLWRGGRRITSWRVGEGLGLPPCCNSYMNMCPQEEGILGGGNKLYGGRRLLSPQRGGRVNNILWNSLEMGGRNTIRGSCCCLQGAWGRNLLGLLALPLCLGGLAAPFSGGGGRRRRHGKMGGMCLEEEGGRWNNACMEPQVAELITGIMGGGGGRAMEILNAPFAGADNTNSLLLALLMGSICLYGRRWHGHYMPPWSNICHSIYGRNIYGSRACGRGGGGTTSGAA